MFQLTQQKLIRGPKTYMYNHIGGDILPCLRGGDDFSKAIILSICMSKFTLKSTLRSYDYQKSFSVCFTTTKKYSQITCM